MRKPTSRQVMVVLPDGTRTTMRGEHVLLLAGAAFLPAAVVFGATQGPLVARVVVASIVGAVALHIGGWIVKRRQGDH